MIRIRPGRNRGRFRNDWLDARFSFSFGAYRDPELEHYSDLLVLNEDRVQPGGGFQPHAHADIEAVSYPIAGVIEHRDSMGNVARMTRGDIQRMTAGSGIVHSEMNASGTEPEHHFQFWIQPAAKALAPAYEQKRFSDADKLGRLRLVVSPDGRDGSLTVHQDARVYAGLLEQLPLEYRPALGRRTYLHVATGALRLGELRLEAGDAAILEAEDRAILSGAPGAEVLLFDLR